MPDTRRIDEKNFKPELFGKNCNRCATVVKNPCTSSPWSGVPCSRCAEKGKSCKWNKPANAKASLAHAEKALAEQRRADAAGEASTIVKRKHEKLAHEPERDFDEYRPKTSESKRSRPNPAELELGIREVGRNRDRHETSTLSTVKLIAPSTATIDRHQQDKKPRVAREPSPLDFFAAGSSTRRPANKKPEGSSSKVDRPFDSDTKDRKAEQRGRTDEERRDMKPLKKRSRSSSSSISDAPPSQERPSLLDNDQDSVRRKEKRPRSRSPVHNSQQAASGSVMKKKKNVIVSDDEDASEEERPQPSGLKLKIKRLETNVDAESSRSKREDLDVQERERLDRKREKRRLAETEEGYRRDGANDSKASKRRLDEERSPKARKRELEPERSPKAKKRDIEEDRLKREGDAVSSKRLKPIDVNERERRPKPGLNATSGEDYGKESRDETPLKKDLIDPSVRKPAGGGKSLLSKGNQLSGRGTPIGKRPAPVDAVADMLSASLAGASTAYASSLGINSPAVKERYMKKSDRPFYNKPIAQPQAAVVRGTLDLMGTLKTITDYNVSAKQRYIYQYGLRRGETVTSSQTKGFMENLRSRRARGAFHLKLNEILPMEVDTCKDVLETAGEVSVVQEWLKEKGSAPLADLRKSARPIRNVHRPNEEPVVAVATTIEVVSEIKNETQSLEQIVGA